MLFPIADIIVDSNINNPANAMFTGFLLAEKERFEFGSKDTFKSNTSKTATFDIENS